MRHSLPYLALAVILSAAMCSAGPAQQPETRGVKDTLIAYTTCYAKEFGLANDTLEPGDWKIDIAWGRPKGAPEGWVAGTWYDLRYRIAQIVYDDEILALTDDRFRRQTVIHEITHILIAPLAAMAAYADSVWAGVAIEQMATRMSQVPAINNACPWRET